MTGENAFNFSSSLKREWKLVAEDTRGFLESAKARLADLLTRENPLSRELAVSLLAKSRFRSFVFVPLLRFDSIPKVRDARLRKSIFWHD